MADTFGSRVKNAWNAFLARDQTRKLPPGEYGMSYSRKPDRVRLSLGNERSIIAALYNRIAIDVSSLSVRHVRVDSNEMYVETIDSPLNECLTLSPNLDQIARSFFQDLVLSLFDEGCVAVVPVETSMDPNVNGSYDIYQLRVARIVEWYPMHVLLDAYDQRDGQHHEFTMRKDAVAIIENPLYAVMNEPNSTLRRLIRKMNLLDSTDEQASSGKLDILIQLPYTIKSTARQQQAEQRRKMIEEQLAGSKYGIAYIDGTERVTQLNRSAENNLQIQIEYLTKLLFNQLGVTEKIFYGEADEQETLNYQNRTIEPIISAITSGMTRSFLTKTARTQGQRVMFFREPFKLVPAEKLADIADKFTRNEILSSNEVRAMIGYRPVDDPRANELRNKNLNASEENPAGTGPMAGGDENQQSQMSPDISEMLNAKMAEQSAISHSGVKGQKWGVRNGPPYPIGKMYRFTSGGEGVYEKFRKSIDKEDWKFFLSSDAAKWLPKPPEGTYDSSKYYKYESYFTQKGLSEFEEKTLPVMKRMIPKFKVSYSEVGINDLPAVNLVYQDEYQKVYGISERKNKKKE